MEYSLLEAAKVARVNKSTVLRAIKGGRLSARREERGTYRIDASELARVFDLRHLATGAPPGAEGAMPQSAAAEATGGAPFAPQDVGVAVEVAVLRERVRALETDRERWERERETILERERETVADLRKRLDRAEERVLALSAPSSPPAAAPVAVLEPAASVPATPPKPRTRFLARLLGRI